MNSQRFSEALNEIDGRYLMEAVTYHRQHQARRPRRWWAAAGCAALMLCAALFAALPRFAGSPARPPLENSLDGAPPSASQATPAVRIAMGDIFINEIGGFTDRAFAGDDPAQYDTATWGREELTAYYGKDLSPAYIPQGLKAAPGNGKAQAVMEKDGTIVSDTAVLAFYHDYYEDGSPKLTDDVPALKGLLITASKTGLLNGCDYLAEKEIKESAIGNTAVTFGAVSLPHGPYDAQTHEPAGYFDLFTAEFEYGGIEYQITAEQLALEELVKVAASIIFEGQEIAIERALG